MRPLAPIPSREFKSTSMDGLETQGIENGKYNPKISTRIVQVDNEEVTNGNDIDININAADEDVEDAENGYSSPVRSIYPRAKTHVIHRSQSFGDLNSSESPHSQYTRKKQSSTSFKEDLLFLNTGQFIDKASVRSSAGSSPLSPSALEPLQVTWGRRDSIQLVSLYSPPPKPDMYSQLLQTSAEKVLTKIKTRQQSLLSDVSAPQHRGVDGKKTLRLTPLVPVRRKLQPLKTDSRSVSAKEPVVEQDRSEENPNESPT